MKLKNILHFGFTVMIDCCVWSLRLRVTIKLFVSYKCGVLTGK